MRTNSFTVERIEMGSEKSFEDLAASIERRIPAADFAIRQTRPESRDGAANPG
jgi:hypothetical protein